MSQLPSSGSTSVSDPDTSFHYRFGMIAIGLLFAPFLIDAFHAAPAADDFCYASETDKSGYLGAIGHYYNNVNGRFFATFLIVSLDRLFPIESAYVAVPLFFFAALCLSAIALFWAVAPRATDWRLKIALGLLFVSILVTNAKSLSEVFYWLSASATYLSATAGTLIALACMLFLARDEVTNAGRHAAAAVGALAAVAAIGSFEASGPVLLTAGAICVACAFIRKGPGATHTVFIMIASGFGLWLNLSAPGTASRAQVMALGSNISMIDFVVIALRCIMWTSEHLAIWGSRASVWLVAFALFWILRDRFPVDWKIATRQRLAFRVGVGGLAMLPYLAAFPMFYAYLVPHPVRAQFLVDVFCLVFWLAILSIAFDAFRKTVSMDSVRLDRRRLSLGLFAAVFVTIAGNENFYQASLDMFRGAQFARQAAAQIADVAKNPNRRHEVVLVESVSAYAPTLTLSSRTLTVSNVGGDPRRYVNVCLAEFTGAYGVRIEPTEDFLLMSDDWFDPDPQAIGRPSPVWQTE